MAGESPTHATLAADEVTEIVLDEDWNLVEVLNVDGAAAVYFTVDGSEPTVEGAGVNVLPAAIGALSMGVSTEGGTVVKLISSGTPKVSVRGLK